MDGVIILLFVRDSTVRTTPRTRGQPSQYQWVRQLMDVEVVPSLQLSGRYEQMNRIRPDSDRESRESRRWTPVMDGVPGGRARPVCQRLTDRITHS